MVCPLAVITPAVVTLCYGVTFFFENNGYNRCSYAPPWAGWIIAVSMLNILFIVTVVPCWLPRVPRICRVFAEILVSTFLFEFCTFYVWCQVEAMICITLRYIFVAAGLERMFDKWQDLITGIGTTTASLLILAIALRITRNVKKIRRYFFPHSGYIERRVC